MLGPSSIRRRDLNPQPLEDESHPITTRPNVYIECVLNMIET